MTPQILRTSVTRALSRLLLLIAMIAGTAASGQQWVGAPSASVAGARQTPRLLLTVGGRKGVSGQWNRILFSPDGRRLLSTGEGGKINFWDATTGKEITAIPADPRW